MHWFDKAAEARGKAVARAFPGRTVLVRGRSQDAKRIVVDVEDDAVAAVYHLVDFAKGTADIIGEDYPELANVALGKVRTFSYPARDGTAIPAYLTLLPGTEAKKLPLVVLPHGGPEARDDTGFDWWSQFLATRGYAARRPQFRGSTGFAEGHRAAGYRQWGRLMQDDVSDGVKALSYISKVTGRESNSLAYWKDHIGPATDPQVIAFSPTHAAAKVRVPVLLMHGVDDNTVPIAQSEYMQRAMETAGKPSTLIRLPGEDHQLSRGETRLRVLTELESFLAKTLAYTPAPAP